MILKSSFCRVLFVVGTCGIASSHASEMVASGSVYPLILIRSIRMLRRVAAKKSFVCLLNCFFFNCEVLYSVATWLNPLEHEQLVDPIGTQTL